MLGADLLIRSIACRYLSVNNEQLDFRTNEYGKPYIYGSNDFHYNLSHSGKWVVCAVDRQPVGIDVEAVAPVDLDIARTFFSPEEVVYIMGRPGAERTGLFYELWTLKESYVKALGCGLSNPLNSFAIKLFGDGKARVKEANPEVFLRQYELDQGYKLAVCSFRAAFPSQINIIDMDWILAYIK